MIHPLAYTLPGALLLTALWPATAQPSSHREAPFITQHPKVDATDLYVFNSYEAGREDNVVFIANYQPLQNPGAGPNYYTMDPIARYEIKIDNNGDSIEDLTFRFTFDTALQDIQVPVGPPGQEVNVSVPLRNVGPITAADSSAQNELETFKINIAFGEGPMAPAHRITELGTGRVRMPKPIDNIGEKTIADYAAYADAFTYDIELPGGFSGRAFVGQRKDPFVVNLGETFDLINTNPLGPESGEADSLADANITSLILELPKAFVTTQNQPTIGVWTTAYLPRTRSLTDDPTFDLPEQGSGGWKQVSRLGMPLVNELLIGMRDKNRFNSSRPFDDGQFVDYYTNPVLPEIIESLFGVSAPDVFPRVDLFSTFLTGLAGLNNNTTSIGEMIRLNTGIPSVPANMQSRVGALGGDFAGFPNGRRPGDDVVDITLRVAMGALFDPATVPDGQLPFTDGAIIDSSFFDDSFPYLRDPLPGSPD